MLQATRLGQGTWIYDNNKLAAGLILNIAYGYNVRDCEDPFVAIADAATRNTVKAGGPGAMLCDMFPMCKLTVAVGRRSRGDLWSVRDIDLPDVFVWDSKVPSGVAPICRVQTACPIHKETCIHDV